MWSSWSVLRKYRRRKGRKRERNEQTVGRSEGSHALTLTKRVTTGVRLPERALYLYLRWAYEERKLRLCTLCVRSGKKWRVSRRCSRKKRFFTRDWRLERMAGRRGDLDRPDGIPLKQSYWLQRWRRRRRLSVWTGAAGEGSVLDRFQGQQEQGKRRRESAG